ncbi:MAG: N-glycosylase/DNA lyase [Candidatus Jordarchaeum sp.]|uniref:N-glycosylase/DNA lyase n=1 Tax=Candidatus Jordarchaeum sp. TaxID=2823881 RepID=UPI00404B1182
MVNEINELKNGSVGEQVSERMKEFEELHKKSDKEWFSELCFCILTAYSSVQMGLKIQNKLSCEDFLMLPLENLCHKLREEGYRFWERRADFIVCARDFYNIKEIITSFPDERLAREWLVKRIKGLGYKEASHFLRNVGFKNVAILDRHVMRIMFEYGLISEIPKTLTRRMYLELEQKLEDLGRMVGLSLGELDLYLWYMKTGKILK